MEDDTGNPMREPLWIDRREQIISFHEEAGYEKLEFPSVEEKMEYVIDKGANGFRIQ